MGDEHEEIARRGPRVIEHADGAGAHGSADDQFLDWRQVSPVYIADLVQPHLVGRTYADIGCGAGVPVSILRARWPEAPPYRQEGVRQPWFIGVDFLLGALRYAAEYGAYDRLVLATSDRLPLDDGEVDVALSLENIEHLYPAMVPTALSELVRIARRRVIITTPWPWDMRNRTWLRAELEKLEGIPFLSRDQFLAVEGCFHKSTLTPDRLARVGFRCASIRRRRPPLAHPVYVGEVDQLDLSKLGPVPGIEPTELPPADADHRPAYAELLRRAFRMDVEMERPKASWALLAAAGHGRQAAADLWRFVRPS